MNQEGGISKTITIKYHQFLLAVIKYLKYVCVDTYIYKPMYVCIHTLNMALSMYTFIVCALCPRVGILFSTLPPTHTRGILLYIHTQICTCFFYYYYQGSYGHLCAAREYTTSFTYEVFLSFPQVLWLALAPFLLLRIHFLFFLVSPRTDLSQPQFLCKHSSLFPIYSFLILLLFQLVMNVFNLQYLCFSLFLKDKNLSLLANRSGTIFLRCP